jgi:2-oxoglutarate ferredoxin oxidoreductase subunit beta
MLRWQKEAAVRVEKAAEMSEEELRDRFTIGVLVDRDLPIYIREYRKIREAARARLEETQARRKALLPTPS